MSLSKQEIEDLMRIVGLTMDDEFDCERCLQQVAEFADRVLMGRSIPAGMEAIAQHLSVCAECREEFEALLRALDGGDA
jgi:hypothetical protein